MSRRSLIVAGLAAAALTISPSPASPANNISATITYAEVNCNWRGYSEGRTVNGLSLSWSARSKRLAAFLRGTVRASLYAVVECDVRMALDLCALMGPQFRYLACDNATQDKNGWIYDSGKLSAGKVANTPLPGGGTRNLLEVGFTHRATGLMLPTAVTHLSSNAPGDRALQMDACLDRMEGKVRLFSGDLNASSSVLTPAAETEAQGPRVQLEQRDWVGPQITDGTWHDYKDQQGLLLDGMWLSPAAQDTGRITIGNFRLHDTYPTLCTDHRVLAAAVTFR